MPVTPFHFGPGAALHAIAPRHVSFLAFCAANVLIDFESLYHLVTHQYPIHTFLHTYVGATLAAIGTTALFAGAKAFARRWWLPDLFEWKSLGLRPIAFGAAAGAYSHVLLDSVMHPDIEPLSPFSSSNALLDVVPLGTLHLFCVISGCVAIVLIAIRQGIRFAKKSASEADI